MQGFVKDIEELTLGNEDFLRVLYAGHNLQLVLMTSRPGEEIGKEVHPNRDQSFPIESGSGEVWIDSTCHAMGADMGVIVPQGASHNVVCTGEVPLRLYTIYGPPEHREGIVHSTCKDAARTHEHFDGVTTE